MIHNTDIEHTIRERYKKKICPLYPKKEKKMDLIHLKIFSPQQSRILIDYSKHS